MPDGVPNDDEIEKRLRELTAEVHKAEKLKHSQQEATRKAAEKAAAREAKASRRAEPGHRARLTAAWLAVAVIVATGGIITWQRLSQPSASAGPGDSRPVTNGPVPAATNSVSPDPFAGSPAEGYADGAEGIVVPSARAVPGFTAEQVLAAYQKTKQVLIAANLDWPTLRGGAPTAYANLLTAQQRKDFVSGLNLMGQDKQGYTRSTRAYIATFAPGTTAFVTRTIKVHGKMSAHTATISGRHALVVDMDYIFVYAVEPPGHPADWRRVIHQFYGSVEFATWDDPGGTLEPWVIPGMSTAGEICAVNDGYIHPQFPNGPSQGPRPSGPAVDPYALSGPLPFKGNCLPTARN